MEKGVHMRIKGGNMKILKVIAAVILAIALLISESLVMGLFSVDKALSEKSIKKSLNQTELISQLVDEAVGEKTVNMGGKYGDIIKQTMETEAMTNFFSEYITSAVRSELYSEEYREVANDELLKAFTAGIDELSQSGAIRINPVEEAVIKQAMLEAIPDLTKDLNSIMNEYDVTDGQTEQATALADEDVQKMLSWGTRIKILLISAVLCAALIALYWRSKNGFIWCAAVTGMNSLVYFTLILTGVGGIFDTVSADPSEQFVLNMMTNGFKGVAIAGLVIMILFIIAYIAFKVKDRRRTI